jgi:hypothetical protein
MIGRSSHFTRRTSLAFRGGRRADWRKCQVAAAISPLVRIVAGQDNRADWQKCQMPGACILSFSHVCVADFLFFSLFFFLAGPGGSHLCRVGLFVSPARRRAGGGPFAEGPDYGKVAAAESIRKRERARQLTTQEIVGEARQRWTCPFGCVRACVCVSVFHRFDLLGRVCTSRLDGAKTRLSAGGAAGCTAGCAASCTAGGKALERAFPIISRFFIFLDRTLDLRDPASSAVNFAKRVL